VKLPQVLKKIWALEVIVLMSLRSKVIIILEHESSQYPHRYIRIAYPVLKPGEKTIATPSFPRRHH